jgi:peptidoglycan/xylan/chitin deacetylase (PgdA/CDA1 family)
VTAIPHYYSSLEPFRELFQSGYPVLTYHHIGPRSRGARLKGLYVSPRLFSRQLTELQSAGFATGVLSDFLKCKNGSVCAGSHRVCLTFDDGFHDIFEHALPLLAQRRARATVFLVAHLIGKTNEWQQRQGDVIESLMDESQIRDWLAAGNEIGSHTLTHPFLTQLSITEARDEIFASKKSLEDRFGVAVNHFCYPYGDWNPAVRDLVAEAGYQTACTTATGINQPETAALELRRFTARYPSRNLKAVWRRLRNFFPGKP